MRTTERRELVGESRVFDGRSGKYSGDWEHRNGENLLMIEILLFLLVVKTFRGKENHLR